ncbi:phosphate/phosphite/phosphonate ABC transporter substrate-binding protein [Pseudoroseomonas wenyumeiae]|uniref:Phosphate/phosphite/phosphonate ABC transporter substrate-binding protein n=1 Tax=Teichococcus wenyumeiae TaxID=2478470 RepID=A0A3A9JFE2_9PROT|nr:phosphate/phosphite/phosphonate ABC transporter substrate-binding protein [Pseudoroseomonas wenyumeiae]RKK03413.1 phosphate/phosphite/phosphonate ABC transporter substrate-binding protein [Pseudoroseomonas wenyumeiae]RMI26598.1 phosphate/phosphite/phosphonate ABC transporter substrate-binding protein [Pseudoroseomonas wenyumeiae]
MPVNRRQILSIAASATLLPALGHAQGATPRLRRSGDADVVFPKPGRRAWAEQVRHLNIALMGGENEADRLARFEGYRALMQDTFGIPVRTLPASDYAGAIQAFDAKQVEIASLGSTAYAAAWMETKGGVEPLVVPEEEDGSIYYRAVMVARADSGIADLAGMKGRSLAWADPNSSSGYLVPRTALRRQGIDVNSYFSRTGFAGGHEQGVVAVLQKQYDAACTWASGLGDESTGFTRGNLRAMVEKGMLKMSDIRVIWTSEPIATGPITVRADLPAEAKEDLKLFFLALPKAHPDIYRQITRGPGTGYREGRHEDYEIFIEMRREEAAARRRRD